MVWKRPEMKTRYTLMILTAICLAGISFIVFFHPEKGKYIAAVASELKTKDCAKNDGMLVIFNRIPKTGSTSFMKVVYQLASRNKFSSLYVNISMKQPMTLFGESWLIKNISYWKSVRPAIFHGHFPYLNFMKHGSKTRPIFINIVRDPLQRLVSFYYFMRYGDDFRPEKKRKKAGDKTTFDECVKKKGRDCKPELLWLQIPYFCGNSPRCWYPGSQWALDQAKKHLADQYFLVGVLEEVEKFVRILDYTLPTIFSGASPAYLEGGGVHVRKTRQKKPLKQETVEFFKGTKIWKLENEFYQFARGLFLKQYDAMFHKRGDETLFKKGKILYQKVRIVNNDNLH